MKDKESERIKAKQRYLEETRNMEKKEQEKMQVLQKLEAEKKRSERNDRKIEHLKKYDNFLIDVITKHSDLYEKKGDLIQRHETLKSANDRLELNRERYETRLDELKKKFVISDKEKSDELLQLNNEIAVLQKDMEVTIV